MFDELRGIMRKTADLLEQGEQAGQEALERRTQQLARVYWDEPDGDTLRVLSFRLGAERYAWPVANVQAIAQVGKLTPVPSVPAFYRGVMSMRGQVLSVMDLGVYLGLPAAQPLPDMLVVIAGAQLEIGVLADDIFDVTLIRPAELTGAGPDPELIRGVTLSGLSLLDADALLGRERRRISEVDRP